MQGTKQVQSEAVDALKKSGIDAEAGATPVSVYAMMAIAKNGQASRDDAVFVESVLESRGFHVELGGTYHNRERGVTSFRFRILGQYR